MADIIIHSRDKEFTQAIEEQIRSQLGLLCTDEASQDTLVIRAYAEKKQVSIAYQGIETLFQNAPFSMYDLISSIETKLKDASAQTQQELAGGYLFLPRQKQLSHKETARVADLTDKEMQLLQHLAASAEGQTREELLRHIWGFEAVLDTHTLETHIYRLRAKARELSEEPLVVATYNGYKLGI